MEDDEKLRTVKDFRIHIDPELRVKLEMKVKVKFFASLREITGKREEDIEVPDDTTVERLIEVLSSKYGKDFFDYVYDERTGKPRDHLQFLVDGRSASTLQGLKTKLRDGCNFAIIPPVGGG